MLESIAASAAQIKAIACVNEVESMCVGVYHLCHVAPAPPRVDRIFGLTSTVRTITSCHRGSAWQFEPVCIVMTPQLNILHSILLIHGPHVSVVLTASASAANTPHVSHLSCYNIVSRSHHQQTQSTTAQQAWPYMQSCTVYWTAEMCVAVLV